MADANLSRLWQGRADSHRAAPGRRHPRRLLPDLRSARPAMTHPVEPMINRCHFPHEAWVEVRHQAHHRYLSTEAD